MKILFYSYAFPNPCEPRLATFNRTMIAGLAKDHDVRVVSPVPFVDAWKGWIKGQLPRGVNDPTFQAVPGVPVEYCTWYYTPKFWRNQYGRFMERSVRSVLNRTIEEFRPNIMLSYWTHPDGEVAVRTAHRHGIRAVTIVGGSDVLLNARSGSRRESILKVLKEADGVITVSDAIKKVLMDDGISDHKLHIVRRGVDREVFHRGLRATSRKKLELPDDLPILVSVGRLVDVKGHTYLIQACQRLVARGFKFRCYLLGDGPLRGRLQNQIEQSGLSSFVELKGSQSAAQLADWYRAADLSVLASLSEGVPNVLLESIACGTPFVGTNVGGIPEIADPYQDQLAPAADPAALADTIATRLIKPDNVPRKPRRFEPASMAQSAAKLSAILQFVQTGQVPQPSVEESLHETMTGQGVLDNQITRVVSNKPTVRPLVQPVPPEEDDPVSRTGEGFHYFT